MSELSARMDLIAQQLAAKYPLRVVTRKAVDPAQRKRDDLLKGVYTIVSTGEQQFTNLSGYSAKDGRQGILIIGDLTLQSDKADGEAVENAEFDMRDEIVAFVDTKAAPLCQLDLVAWHQSGQVVRPNGWAIFELRYVP